MRIVNQIWLLVTVFLFSACSLSPSKLEHLSGSTAADFSKQLYSDFEQSGNQDGTGPHPYLPALKHAPKNIGLISFYIESAPHKKVNPYAFVSTDGSNKFADGLFENGLKSLKQTFAKVGMNIITPKEFAKNDQHQFTYIQYNANNLEKLMTRLKSISPKQSNELAVSAIPKDFQYNPNHLLANDPANNESLNRLRLDLNLDALLTVVNFVEFDGSSLGITNAHMFIHGPNPIKPIRGQSYRGFEYVAGHLYAHGAIKFQPALTFADIQVSGFFSDKIILKEEIYKGYADLLTILGSYTANNLLSNINQ